jgi:hypothetical protein
VITEPREDLGVILTAILANKGDDPTATPENHGEYQLES